MLRLLILGFCLIFPVLLAGPVLAAMDGAGLEAGCHRQHRAGLPETPPAGMLHGNRMAASVLPSAVHSPAGHSGSPHIPDCCSGAGFCPMAGCAAPMIASGFDAVSPLSATRFRFAPSGDFALRGRVVPPMLGPPRLLLS